LNQAKPGEELVIYTLGLGVTTPAVKEGEASPTPAATVSVGLDFDFSPNAGPSTPGQRRDPGTPPLPVFAGLSPGSAGLYQVNFVVPTPPPGTPACFGTVHSNLTVSVIGANSTDGAGICVTSSDGTHLKLKNDGTPTGDNSSALKGMTDTLMIKIGPRTDGPRGTWSIQCTAGKAILSQHVA
jgi:hypothetical protein